LSSPDAAVVGAAFALPGEGGGVEFVPFPVAPSATARPEIVDQDGWRVLVESVRPNPTLVVMGCGHIGAALVELAAGVGFDVIAVDDRIDYASAERLPGAKRVVCDDLPGAARTLPSGPDTYWVVVTRGHRNDGRVIAQIVNRPHAYIGMIGSRRKVRIIREGLMGEGIATAEQLANLHAPVGLDIGAESPQEIALSIAAQLVAARHGKL
jgi:xanthine dehydrogenase accessory factor